MSLTSQYYFKLLLNHNKPQKRTQSGARANGQFRCRVSDACDPEFSCLYIYITFTATAAAYKPSSYEKHIYSLQVFCILMVQLMVTFSVVSLFTFW